MNKQSKLASWQQIAAQKVETKPTPVVESSVETVVELTVDDVPVENPVPEVTIDLPKLKKTNGPKSK